MSGRILDGTSEAGAVLDRVAKAVELLAASGKKPRLAAIQANDDPGTNWYARAQEKHCRENGVDLRLVKLAGGAAEGEVVDAVGKAGDDPDVSAVLVFTPLPDNVSQLRVVEAIKPEKDAEGVHPANLGRLLVASRADPAPCTAMACLRLVKTARPDLSGARALVIGRSATVGKPLALLLLAEHATVTVAHTRSDIRPIMPEAEVVVAAAGAAGAKWRAYERRRRRWREGGGVRPVPPNLDPLVSVDMVRRGAIIVDVGDNDVPLGLDADGAALVDENGEPAMRYAGDVDFDKVKDVAGFITRPRGSVGPLTNAFLLWNVARAALAAAGIDPAEAMHAARGPES
ncbi:MAG: bifunctional 5,10-methylenetetrahydrofolate dehydrogenase/5,10-methenyltetrahydrofolate cyclohydrolase [Planctomycetota bacterium]|jgi:methylenetetrahydrofolate dehydrogenase (NADP+)/methenyltetrahydrofolate cyclohydrolase|nr:bifunctional 5,10-methylenetetrahydrofolate dehydrogenase/5,10-methenyltetrahydrofolate cyclohydrolase [Planctomycetota bacterium]